MSSPGIPQKSPAWFAARRGRITASIAGACLGLNPYCSAKKAWRIIRGTEVEESNPNIARGNRLEDAAIRLYEARHGVQVVQVGFLVHPRFSWLGCSPDGLVRQQGCLEVKCPKKLPESVPEYHVVQMLVQLACTGRTWADYLAYVGPGQIFEQRIVRDVAAETVLLEKLQAWYETYVAANVEPPVKFRLRHLVLQQEKPND